MSIVDSLFVSSVGDDCYEATSLRAYLIHRSISE